jgi:hypothetical protein
MSAKIYGEICSRPDSLSTTMELSVATVYGRRK